MPDDATTLEYATPVGGTLRLRITGTSVVRFLAGLCGYGVTAWSISRLDSMAGAILLGRFSEPVLWVLGLGFLWFVVHAQRKWRWTGFTLGVVAGVGLTVIGFIIFFLLWARGMSAF